MSKESPASQNHQEPDTSHKFLRDREDRVALLLPTLLLLAVLLHFSLVHGLDLWSPEMLLLTPALLLLGALVGLAIVGLRSPNIRAVALALVCLAAYDLQAVGSPHLVPLGLIDALGALGYINLIQGIALTLPVLLLALLLKRHLASILAVMTLAFMVSTIAVPPHSSARSGQEIVALSEASAQDQAPILHIVMDGHIGLDGIPEDIEGGSDLKATLTEFYLRHGFRLFSQTYSQYFFTRFSLASLMNSGPMNFRADLTDRGGNRWILNRNEYFRDLKDRGYLIRVYQSDYMNFCRVPEGAFEICTTFPAANPRLVQAHDLPLGSKTLLLAHKFLEKSTLHQGFAQVYDNLAAGLRSAGITVLPQRTRTTYSLFSLDALNTLDQLKQDLAAAPRGRVFFVHLMLPHGPYIFREDCSVRPNASQWRDRRREHANLLSSGSASYREAAYRDYFAQTHCLIKNLDEVFEVMKRAGVWDEATILLHGDHGSRITTFDPVEDHFEEVSERDMIDSYSTFYAIHRPDVVPGTDTRRVSIQDLFAEQVFGEAPKAADAPVNLISRKLEKPQVSMVPISPPAPGSSPDE